MSDRSIVITGAAGFMGIEFLKQVLESTDYNVIIVDCMSYAANERDMWVELAQYPEDRVTVCQQRLQELSDTWKERLDKIKMDYVFNFAAESHVDNSNKSGEPFISSNILGTYRFVEYLRTNHPELKCFFQISTDEVYGMTYNENYAEETGELPDAYEEIDDYDPTSYYATSKAAAEMFVKSANKVWGFPYIITRSCNNFGPFQHAEKFIPKFIKSVLTKVPFTLYGDGKQSRQWVSSSRHADCLLELMLFVESGDIETCQIFNIGGHQLENTEMMDTLLVALDKTKNEVLFDDSEDRPGHDLAYNLNSNKLDNLVGDYPWERFQDELKDTVRFYRERYPEKSADEYYDKVN